jgi:S1-C subfamily serine protease
MSEKNNPLVLLSKTLADAAEKAGASTVLVHGRRRMPSSGIAYADDLVLTADHTIEHEGDISVMLPDGTELEAEIAGRDPSTDLALLRLSQKGAAATDVLKQEVRVGELVLALGRPSSQGIEASLGVVSAINGPVRTRRGGMIEKFIRTDAIPLPGFSGGPLVNGDGLVIGINTSGLSHGMLLTLPVSLAWKVAKNLAEHGSIKRGYLGISSQTVEIPKSSTDLLDRSQKTGLLVSHIEGDSPAADSDLLVGDIIVGINTTPVEDHDALAGLLVGDVVGTPVTVEILRGGKLSAVSVTVGERPLRHSKKRGRKRKHRRGHGHHRHP